MDKSLIKQELNSFSRQKRLSKGSIAKMLGVSPATLSNIEHERWDKVSDEMALKIWGVLNSFHDKIIETGNFQRIFDACTLAKERTKMVGIIGSTGYGKTTALTEYYRSHSNTYLITCKKSMTAKQLLQTILKAMGISFNGTVFHIIEKISQELNKQHSPLLIIDEAGKLSQIVMEYLHDLRNATERNAGIVMAGVEYFKNNLSSAAEKNKEGMPEFYDRISRWSVLEQPTQHEIRSICHLHGIYEEQTIRKFFKVDNFRQLSNYIETYIMNHIQNDPLQASEKNDLTASKEENYKEHQAIELIEN